MKYKPTKSMKESNVKKEFDLFSWQTLVIILSISSFWFSAIPFFSVSNKQRFEFLEGMWSGQQETIDKLSIDLQGQNESLSGTQDVLLKMDNCLNTSKNFKEFKQCHLKSMTSGQKIKWDNI